MKTVRKAMTTAIAAALRFLSAFMPRNALSYSSGESTWTPFLPGTSPDRSSDSSISIESQPPKTMPDANASMQRTAMSMNGIPEKKNAWKTSTFDIAENPPANANMTGPRSPFALSLKRTRSGISPWTRETTTMTIPCVLPMNSSTIPFRSPVAVAAPFLRVMPSASMIHRTCSPARNCPAPKGTPDDVVDQVAQVSDVGRERSAESRQERYGDQVLGREVQVRPLHAPATTSMVDMFLTHLPPADGYSHHP